MSPVIRGSRSALALLVALGLAGARGSAQGGSAERFGVDIGIAVLVVVLGVVQWLVTRWAFDGVTLFVETGLIRRDSRQLPVARIQAVDLVRPWLARVLGLAEVRLQMAGADAGTRLAYLPEARAEQLRAALLAAHHGLHPATPTPAEQPLVSVPPAALVASILLSGLGPLTVVVVVGAAVGATVSSKSAAFVGTIAIYLFALVAGLWRRFNALYGFTLAAAPDGLRIRRGLLSTVSETVPLRRVQAVRLVEPLWWRPFGWCRVQVDLAGMPGRDRNSGPQRITKILLPVGPRSLGTTLVPAVLGVVAPDATQPPRRAAVKAPLSFHFLAAGHDDTTALAVTGRLTRVSAWIPLEKVQSVRRVQGPIQRRLGLATLHLDVAGRGFDAAWRDRDAAEVEGLVGELATLMRSARRRLVPAAAASAAPSVGVHPSAPSPSPPTGVVPAAAPPPPAPPPPAAPPPAPPAGWFPDPSGRHQHRYWDGTRWTEHVADGGQGGVDPG